MVDQILNERVTHRQESGTTSLPFDPANGASLNTSCAEKKIHVLMYGQLRSLAHSYYM